MVRVLTKAGFIVLMIFTMTAVPAPVAADTISVTQVITITATVAPARSIVVDADGNITSVVSNTNESVTPKVYTGKVHGQELPLTPQLKQQYDAIIAQQTNLNGVEIPVNKPAERPRSLLSFMTKLPATTGLWLPLIKP